MAKEKLTYETKMLRHAGRELDKLGRFSHYSGFG